MRFLRRHPASRIPHPALRTPHPALRTPHPALRIPHSASRIPHLKICDLTQFYSPASGGVRRYVGEKVKFLREHAAPEDEHILIVPGERDTCTGDERARTYTIASPLVSRTARYRVLLRLEAIERILESERPGIIESGDPYQVAWKAVHSGAALGIPVVGFYHSHFPEAYIRTMRRFFGRTVTGFFMDCAKRYIRSLYGRFERTIVPSPALAAVLAGWGVKNTVHLDLGVDPMLFHPHRILDENIRAELAIPADRTLLLYAGRLAQEKNTRTLFAAFRLLAARDPDRFHLLVIGDGAQRAALHALIASHPSRVTHLSGCADSARLAQFYRAADLFVHPGVQETFGLVTIEAQACGTPVIGIAGSTMDRLIHNGIAIWARENSPAALAAAIRDAANAGPASDPMALHLSIAAQYAWPLVFTKLFDLYRSVIAEWSMRRR